MSLLVPESYSDINAFIDGLPSRPGVYRMLDKQQQVIYVGKAVNLKKRVSSYFKGRSHNNKTQIMVSKIISIEVTITHSETEALLLENTLIKSLKPTYNILLRDDKSYPYVFISDKHDYPAIQYIRGKPTKHGSYFGPYTSTKAVSDSLNILQKLFLLRQCEDSFFAHRQRPCLQFQINRCSGPCTNEITVDAYAQDVKSAILYLQGKSQALLHNVSEQMTQAAEDLDFERATILRNQLTSLRHIQEQQNVVSKRGNLDVFAVAMSAKGQSIHHLMIRNGQVVGSKNYFPKWILATEKSDLAEAFLGQFYLSGRTCDIPDEAIVSDLKENTSLAKAINEQAGQSFKLSTKVRGQRAKWLSLASTNATQALHSYIANKQTQLSRFQALQEALSLEKLPERIECFDISHSSGEATVASCVVFDQTGPKKSDYRTFNINNITPGDDYAAMHQALTRRYTRVKENNGILPDILIVDGGKGQVTQAKDILTTLELQHIYILGVAKGETRKAGLEIIIDGWRSKEIAMQDDDASLHLIQHIRDESHRFAVAGHRSQRKRARNKSVLQQIEGVGVKRRQALLRHFGSLSELNKASLDEIAKVQGINSNLAHSIYCVLHDENK